MDEALKSQSPSSDSEQKQKRRKIEGEGLRSLLGAGAGGRNGNLKNVIGASWMRVQQPPNPNHLLPPLSPPKVLSHVFALLGVTMTTGLRVGCESSTHWGLLEGGGRLRLRLRRRDVKFSAAAAAPPRRPRLVDWRVSCWPS